MAHFELGSFVTAASRAWFCCRRFFRDRSGVVILITALVPPVVVGFVALGVETALWYTQRNSLQAAADAAAIAGAYELRRGKDTADIVTAALEEAKRNGYAFTPESNAINVPPDSGEYTDDNAVEAILNASIDLLFSTYFIDGLGQIEARAVARVGDAGEACILSLDPDASDSVLFTGNTDVSVNNCVVASNSSDSSAVSVAGSAAVETDCVAVVGEVSATDGLVLTECDAPVTGSAPINDPYSDVAVPTSPYYCDENNFKITGNPNQQTTISPGRYCGGMSLQAGKITMQSGVHLIADGDFEIRAQAEVQGSGVTIVLLNSTGNSDPTGTINGGAEINLTAPTSGELSGIVFLLDRYISEGTNTFNGNSSTNFTGALYFPTQTVKFLGNNDSLTGCTQIVALKIEFRGNAGLSNQCDYAGTSPISIPGNVQLVE